MTSQPTGSGEGADDAMPGWMRNHVAVTEAEQRQVRRYTQPTSSNATQVLSSLACLSDRPWQLRDMRLHPLPLVGPALIQTLWLAGRRAAARVPPGQGEAAAHADAARPARPGALRCRPRP